MSIIASVVLKNLVRTLNYQLLLTCLIPHLISEKLEEHIFKSNHVPVSKVKVTIDITSPFPTLNTVSIEGSTPIVDPYSVMGIVHELFPHFDEDMQK